MRFDIYSADGMRRIYKAAKRVSGGYGWASPHGFVSQHTINAERLLVVPTVELPENWA